MPSSDEQLAFILCCLKHGNITSGQIPFDKVVEELDIPTIGAAQKRWSRLMQSLRESAAKVGNADSAGDAKKTKTKAKTIKSKATKVTKAAEGAKGNAGKKRKVEEEDEADFKDEDSEA
ncbi:hypothetical protein MN608_00992 [Microdochium nivale]|nr:hypothetical protein MN608_00992 [Microdochium nivale]